jgi:hypothetical protein
MVRGCGGTTTPCPQTIEPAASVASDKTAPLKSFLFLTTFTLNNNWLEIENTLKKYGSKGKCLPGWLFIFYRLQRLSVNKFLQDKTRENCPENGGFDVLSSSLPCEQNQPFASIFVCGR